ncbi:MAG: hypothetical protein IKR21_03555 [Oscillospiraceae bacterium]|nr:hypothetical protein [Oscillospiraceae bacterium]
MKYTGRALGADTELSVEEEGIRLGSRFLDYADVESFRPVNHRVMIDTLGGEQIEVSMLGFSFDGFWEELSDLYGKRSLQALFVEEEQLMLCEGEYEIPGETGRGNIALYPDAVCILPPGKKSLRLPLCFTEKLEAEGYKLTLSLRSGLCCTVGKMGYDTMPFFQRAEKCAAQVKKQRQKALSALPLKEPFTEKGLFRTERPEQYWNAAFGPGVCALEFLTDEDAATYIYRFSEPKELFLMKLEEATEAMGIHREIIYLPDEKIAEKPLYRMAVDRSEAVRYLRARSAGRLIHNQSHARRLAELINC